MKKALRFFLIFLIASWPMWVYFGLGYLEFIEKIYSDKYYVFTGFFFLLPLYAFIGGIFALIASLKKEYYKYTGILVAHVIACAVSLLYLFQFVGFFLGMMTELKAPITQANIGMLTVGFSLFTMVRAIVLFIRVRRKENEILIENE